MKKQRLPRKYKKARKKMLILNCCDIYELSPKELLKSKIPIWVMGWTVHKMSTFKLHKK